MMDILAPAWNYQTRRRIFVVDCLSISSTVEHIRVGKDLRLDLQYWCWLFATTYIRSLLNPIFIRIYCWRQRLQEFYRLSSGYRKILTASKMLAPPRPENIELRYLSRRLAPFLLFSGFSCPTPPWIAYACQLAPPSSPSSPPCKCIHPCTRLVTSLPGSIYLQVPTCWLPLLLTPCPAFLLFLRPVILS